MKNWQDFKIQGLAGRAYISGGQKAKKISQRRDCAEMRECMIDFEEEIKKFHPSLEVEEAEDAIYNNDLTDAVDLMLEVMKEKQQ